jgi:lysophospholipase L1-like esterase
VPADIPRWRRVLYAATAVAIFFAAAEFILRVHDFKFYYNFSADLLGMPLLDMFRFRRIADNMVKFDKNVFWKFKPNQTLRAKGIYLKPVRINNQGFRGPDFKLEKRPHSFRIICLGDSVTFGWSVGDDETYPAQLSTLLKQKNPGCDIEVLNLGVTGYTSFQGKQLFLAFAQELKPDVVIMGFGQNDRYPALLSDEEHFQAGTWQPNKIDLVLRHSQVYKLLKSGVVYTERRRQGLSLDPKTYFPKLKRKVSEQEYLANIKIISDECGKIGCRLVMLNDDFPSLPQDPALQSLEQLEKKSGASLPADFKQWNLLKANSQAALESGAAMLDLRGLFGGQNDPDALMIDKGHPNKQGHQIIADSIAQIMDADPAFQEFIAKCKK